MSVSKVKIEDEAKLAKAMEETWYVKIDVGVRHWVNSPDWDWSDHFHNSYYGAILPLSMYLKVAGEVADVRQTCRSSTQEIYRLAQEKYFKSEVVKGKKVVKGKEIERVQANIYRLFRKRNEIIKEEYKGCE